MGSPSLLVLVADDDADVSAALAHVLRSHGHRVVLAADGQQALERLAQGPAPCAVLLDWMMPRVDGQTFLRTRAASTSLASVPVLVVSATHAPAADDRIQGFLSKPVEVDELLAMVQGVCDAHCPTPRRSRCPQLSTAPAGA